MDDIFISTGDDLLLGGHDGVILGGNENLLSESESLVGPQGPPGPPGQPGKDGRDGVDGQNATVAVGTTTTGAPGTSASVVNTGTTQNAVFNFTIPAGATGEQGPSGIDGINGVDGFSPIASVEQTEYGAEITITDSNGTTTAQVVNGSQGEPGTPGAAATITVGSTTTGAAGTSASVVNSGSSSAAVLDFVIPQGADGAAGSQGPAGPAATITVGSTTTGAAGTSASVVNSGTSSAAVLDFVIPKGDTGAQGPAGDTNTIKAGTATIPGLNSYAYTTVSITIPTQTSTNYSAVVCLSGSTSYWTWLRFTIANKTTTGFDIGVYNDGSGATGDVDVDYIVVKHF